MIGSILREFPQDVAAHLESRWPPSRSYDLPKIDDLVDGHVVYDALQAAKQPDWTYASPDGG